MKEPVNDPVFTCADADTTVGLLLMAPHDVPAYEAEDGKNVILVAAEDVVANDAEPKKLPVKEPVKEPVLTCAELETSVGLFTSVLKSPPAEPGAHEALTA